MKSLQEIEDYYINLGYKEMALVKALARDKNYQKLLKKRKNKLRNCAKATPVEKKKYILSTNADYEILEKVKQLEKLKLINHDRKIVKLIRTQLEREWRKHLLKKLNEMLKKYVQNY